ncbi:hypothetical protein E2C01_042525 [Portunus trituberculatus]|uniref:Uncharacterized protein n=1 Tax=Portunus trituberculatus TaxID=210409 RepID=A0A5B7FQH1_PORTR|nr:hypothetical protein [Portunus trituberculatus]
MCPSLDPPTSPSSITPRHRARVRPSSMPLWGGRAGGQEEGVGGAGVTAQQSNINACACVWEEHEQERQLRHAGPHASHSTPTTVPTPIHTTLLIPSTTFSCSTLCRSSQTMHCSPPLLVPQSLPLPRPLSPAAHNIPKPYFHQRVQNK